MKNLIEAAQADKIEILTHRDKGRITFVGETFVARKSFPRKDIWKEVATLRKTPIDESKSFKEHLEELGFEYDDFSQPQEEPRYEPSPYVYTISDAYGSFECNTTVPWMCYFMGLLNKKPSFYTYFTNKEGNYSCTIYDHDERTILFKAGDPCPYVTKPYKEGLLEPPPPPYWDITVKAQERRFKESTEEERQNASEAFRRMQKGLISKKLFY